MYHCMEGRSVGGSVVVKGLLGSPIKAGNPLPSFMVGTVRAGQQLGYTPRRLQGRALVVVCGEVGSQCGSGSGASSLVHRYRLFMLWERAPESLR